MHFVPSKLGIAAALLLTLLPMAPIGAQSTSPATSSSSSGSSAIPTFAEVNGRDFGERITTHAEMRRYLEALDAASPRVKVVDQGASWEGRRLLLAIVTSPENHARLDSIRETASKLDDPRGQSAEESASRLANQPIVSWLGGSIHGFELSGSEGLLMLLERLTTQNDAETLKVLNESVVLIDPILNPDGRDAFAHFNHRRIAREPNSSPRDWANDTTFWEGVGFRTGHYFFDTNRDWFAHTQKETLHRATTLREWRPQIVIDAHEQGRGSEFFFDPPTEPYGPYFPAYARKGFELFGKAYSDAFDEKGFEYMTGESYNYFYPGYTTSWGSYQGAVGMLFEQGSSRGLALERPDESVRTLLDASEQQYTVSWAAVHTAAEHREALLEDYVEAHRAAIQDGSKGIRHFLLPLSGSDRAVADAGDPGHHRELLDLLQRNGIEVEYLTKAVRLQNLVDRAGDATTGRSFPAGTAVVSTAQPRNPLIRVLLEPDTPVSAEFLAEARARIDRGEGGRFYDITAFSLPLMFDLPAYGSSDAVDLPTDSAEPAVAESEELARAKYAYLFDGSDARSLAALHRMTREGYRAAMLMKDSRLAGEVVPAGTTIVRVGQNPDTVHEAVRSAARDLEVAVRAVDTGRAEKGLPSLGSRETSNARPVEVGVLAEMPIHAYSFGWTWYTLEEQYGIPTHVLRTGHLARTPIDHLDTLVIPDLFGGGSALAEVLGEGGISRLKRFVQEGGTLVASGRSVDFVRNHLEMTALRSWTEENTEGEGKDAVRPQTFRVPGAIFRAEIDRQSWLAAGVGEELPMLVFSNRIYLEPEGPPSGARRVVAKISEEGALMSGHAWEESLERLPGAVLVYEEFVGAGRVILFAEDPTFRAFHRGTDRLFLNAVVFGPNGN